MNYSLGNMLKGGGALNPDGLSLDLAFALDKTLTARKGPTPTFTRASTATFIGSDGLIQSAAVNVPRFDHDPVTGVCRGLLIEESRTNLIRRSEELDNAAWGAISNVLVTPNTTIAPDGLLSADTVDFTAASSFLYQGNTATAGTTYTFSVYLASLTKTQTVLRLVGTQSAGGDVKAIISLTPTLTRYSLSFTLPAGNTGILAGFENRTAIGGGDGSTGTIVAWGAQVEAGAFPTSYIPTTTAALTRSADVCSITGADFTSFYNQSEGTVVIDAQQITTGGVYGIHGDIRSDGAVALSAETIAPIRSRVHASAFSIQAQFDVSIPAGSRYKTAFALKADDFASSTNGGTVGTDTSGILVNTFNRLILGANGNQGGPQASSVIVSRFQYFRKRLPNAKLQTLTT